MVRKVIRLMPLVSALCLCAACNSKAQLYPVQGKVFFADKPAEGALVVFHPADDAQPRALRPSGQVNAQGSFVLGTYAPGDGAPAGEYLVAIVWLGDRKKMNPETGDVPNKLPERYGNPETSQLRASVKSGPTELEPFKLTP